MTDSAMVLRQMLPWQMNSTFICSFISSQFLSNARKYWVCGVFQFSSVFSFLFIIEHISSVVWLNNWCKSLKSSVFWYKNWRIFFKLMKQNFHLISLKPFIYKGFEGFLFQNFSPIFFQNSRFHNNLLF